MDRVQAGDVLVTDMTDPDWEPVMKRAAAIVTNRGGRTCHAAIIARELGIPAVVGCGDATQVLRRRRAGHRVVRRGRHRPRLRRACSTIEVVDVALDRMPPCADQDHDERRQSRARVRVPPAAERRRRPRAPRVHHQHATSASIRRRCSSSTSSRPSSSARSRERIGGVREPDRVLRRARSPKAWRRSPRRSGRRR